MMFVRNPFSRLLSRSTLIAALALAIALTLTLGNPSAPAEAQSGDLYLTKTVVNVEEGYMEEFGVRPASKPSNQVIVTIEVIEQVNAVFAVYVVDSYGTTLRCGTGSVCQLRFDPVNWNQTKYVGVGALPDDDNENGSGKIKIYTYSDDSNFNGIQKIVGTNEDDQVGAPVPTVKAIVVSAGSDIYVNEGGTAFYDVELSQEPDADVTVTVSASGDGSITVSPASLTFTTGNYDTTQSVTLTAAEDDDGQAGTATISHSAANGGYNGVSRNLTANEVENDKVEYIVSPAPAPLQLTEGGTSHSHTVKLGSQPTADVALAIAETPNDDGITVSPTSLTFTTSTWNTAQTVTIAAVEDSDYTADTATVSHTIITSDTSGYGSLSIGDIVVTAKDNDAAIFIDTDPNTAGNQTSLVLEEGRSSATYKIKLSNQPTGNVTVSISETQNPSTGNVKVTSSKSLTFTTSSWDTTQTVTVRAYNDQDAINGTPTINHAASGGGFDNIAASVSVTEIDSQMGISTKQNNSNVTAVTVTEASTATYDVSINAKPATNVTVAIAAATTGNYTDSDITVSPASLNFTPQNYNTAQTVTLTAANDIDVADGRRVISHTATYAGRTFTKDITAREDDDDTGGLTFDTNAVNVNENGTGTYQVKLTHKPHGTVYVQVRGASGSGNDYDISVRDTNDSANGNQTGSIPFTADNYDTYRTVTLAARNDADSANGSRTINHTANGGGYSNVTGSVTATEVDDDHGIFLSPSSVSVTEEGTATYAVKLATAPTANVTVAIAESATAPNNDASIMVTTPTTKSLTFTSLNYSTAQTVTLTAAQDSDRADGSRDITHTATSSDSDYNNLSVTLTATEDDDDSAGDRDTIREFNLASGNGDPWDIWSNDTTMWVLDRQDEKLYAYTLATGAADTSKDISLDSSNGSPRGIWSDGTTIWVADNTSSNNLKAYAYTLSTGARVTAKEFSLYSANRDPRGMWSDGTTLWVANNASWGTDRVWAYNLATGALDTSRSFEFHSDNARPNGIWSDGTTLWVADETDGKLYAYTLVGGTRDTTKDVALHTDNADPYGIWSNGTTMWAVDYTDGKVYAYHAPAMTQRLTADDATASTMRLTIAWHPENWYYKYTTPSGGKCSGMVSAASTRATGLSPNRAYTFAAYSDSTCSTLLATANALETRGSHLALSAFSKTTTPPTTYDVTLTLANWDNDKDGNWSYKTNLSGARGNCVEATANPATVDDFSFSANETHRFTAYRGSTCSGTAIASAPRFKPSDGIPDLTAGSITLNSAKLTLSNYTGTWYYNSEYGSTGCKWAGSGTATLSNLARGTEYTYYAFSSSGCKQVNRIDTVSFTSGAPGDHIVGKGFTPPTTNYGSQIWSDGTTMWVLYNGSSGDKLFAYTLATGANDTSKEFNLHADNNFPHGIWSDGTTVWVAENDSTENKLYAYTLATGARVTSKEFTLHADNGFPEGMWSDGTTIWVGDSDDGKAYAYTLATGARVTAKDINLHSHNNYPKDFWSDGETLWVAESDQDNSDTDGVYESKLYAYNLTTGARDTAKEYYLARDGNSIVEANGIWSDGTIMWVNYGSWPKIYAYYAYKPEPVGPASPGPPPSLTAGSVTLTGATLTLSNHTAAWWHNSDYGETGCTRVSAGTDTASLKRLKPGTSYTLHAYSASGCAETRKIASVSFTTSTPGDRITDKSFTLNVNNDDPTGVWSDGATLWVSNNRSFGAEKVYAYTLSSGANDTAKDITLHADNLDPSGVWSDGTTMWVADSDNVEKLFAYTLATGARDTAKEFNLASSSWGQTTNDNANPRGLWSDGTTIWVGDTTDKKVYAYTLAGGARARDKEFALDSAHVAPWSYWSDGTTLWVSDNRIGKDRLFAYTLATGKRDMTREFDLETGSTSQTNIYPYGIWSDGATLWVASSPPSTYDSASAYHMYPPTKQLIASGIGHRGATLNITWHDEDWWYKRIAPTGNNSCRKVSTGTDSATLTGLNSGTKYVYNAYDNSGCRAGVIATAKFSTTTLIADDASATTVGLTITNHTGDWYYKYTSPSGGQCSAAVTEASTRARGLTVGREYTFAAYSNSACSTLLTRASPVSTLQPTLEAVAGSEAGTVTLNLRDGWVITEWLSVPPWIVNKDGSWHVKYTSPAGGVCSTPQIAESGTPPVPFATVTNLTVGVAYTFSAYADSACTKLVATASPFTPASGGAGGAGGAFGPQFQAQHMLPEGATIVPEAPAGVNASRSNGDIAVSWAAVDGATGYDVQYSTDDKATWTRAATNHPGTSYTLSSADSTKTYVVGVRAVNDSGESAWTESAAVSPGEPSPPSSVSVTHNGGSLSVSWTAVDGATGYDVQYSTDAKATWTSAATKQTGTSYTLSSADNTKTYVVGVRAVNDAGESDWTDSVAVSPPEPSPPSSVSVVHNGGSLSVSWTASAGATRYDVQYSTDAKATWTRAATNQSGTSYTLSSADSTKTYVVGVRAVNDAGESDWTNSDAVSPPEPSPPSSVSVTHNGGSLSVSWSASAGATGYDVQYSTDSKATWTRAATNHSGTSYTLSSADSTKTYVVGVRAVNDAGESDWTESAPASPPASNPPNAVASVSVVHNGGSLSVSWSAADRATGYDVVYSTDNKSSWERAATNHSGTSYTLDDADASKTYVVSVRAVNSAGESWWTDSSPATPAAPEPVASVSAVHNGNSLSVSWTAAERAASYHVTYSDDGGQSWMLAALKRKGTSLTIDNVDAGKTYVVGVRAENAAGFSGWTNSGSAIPP